ncbi:MAG: glycosyltransferase family 2 protein [Prevotellaceae bacterium]|jgi:glycosyltransferase involved in cell wall biosynthesis|nr:glycosyltransferase family 2 protein [Prevotellaceae bacterium]
MQPLLSIIIPTKNRYETLIPVVNAFIDNIQGAEYEIIIQDNSNNNREAMEWLEQQKDSRIKYFYESQTISITENTNRAFENSYGEYIIFIGDDDFVSPYVLDIVNMMKEKDIENITYYPGYYWWESIEFVLENYYHRKKALWMSQKIDTVLQKKDAKKKLDEVLRNGSDYYYDLPRVYHGLTKRSVLEKIKTKTGVYLIGSCPDMAFSVSVALVLDYYYYMNFPVSIFGGSKNSAAGLEAKKILYAKLEDVSILPPTIVETWNKNIPCYWTAGSITVQSAYEVLQSFDSNKRINFIPYYAAILVNEKKLVYKMFPLLFRYARFNLLKYIEFILFVYKKIAGRILRKYKLNHRKMPYDVSIQSNAEVVMCFLKRYHFYDDK